MLRLGLRRAIAPMRAAAAHAHAPAPSAAAPSSSSVGQVVLANIEGRWASISNAEREAARKQVAALMKNDWKKLSAEDKAASYFLAYGHTAQPKSDHVQVWTGVVASMVIAYGIVFLIKVVNSPPAPRTFNKEWQEASNAKLIGQKSNPLTGISSEGYKGKGYVQ